MTNRQSTLTPGSARGEAPNDTLTYDDVLAMFERVKALEPPLFYPEIEWYVTNDIVNYDEVIIVDPPRLMVSDVKPQKYIVLSRRLVLDYPWFIKGKKDLHHWQDQTSEDEAPRD